jgi:hypothetical protein
MHGIVNDAALDLVSAVESAIDSTVGTVSTVGDDTVLNLHDCVCWEEERNKGRWRGALYS